MAKPQIMQDMIIKKKSPSPEVLVPQKNKVLPLEKKIIKSPVPKKSYGLLIISVSAVMVLGLVIGGLFSETVIRVTPRLFSTSLDATLLLARDRGRGGVSFATASKEFTEEEIVPSVRVATESQAASGMVRIFNRGSASVLVPENTILESSEGGSYHTTETVTIVSSEEVVIEADALGREGNSPVADFTFSDTESFATLTVRGITAIIGGSAPGDAVADPSTIQDISQKLRAKLFQKEVVFRTLLAEELPDEMVMLPITLTPSQPRITTHNDPEGLVVRAHTTLTILAANRKELAEYLKIKLPEPPPFLLTVSDLEPITMTTNVPLDPDSLPETFTVRGTGMLSLVGSFEEEGFRIGIPGMSKKELKAKLSTMPEITSFTITMRPPWRRKVPLDPQDITILIDF